MDLNKVGERMRIVHVVGARPNFMKVAPIIAEMERRGGFDQRLVHTGQHDDANMSSVFFEQLDLPEPDEHLGVGSGTHAEQTARAMTTFEVVLRRMSTDWVVVVGDVNSTLACSLVCAKLGVPVAHVEAGLRSGDRSMPEEINRVVTDTLSDLLFTPSRDGDANLLREGVEPRKIRFVGNVMIDTLVRLLPVARERSIVGELRLEERDHVLVTLHRPSNVDKPETLREVWRALQRLACDYRVLFPVHPRTSERLADLGLARNGSGVELLKPLGYLDFLALMDRAALVLTDSGGVQEETTWLGVPCLTTRPNTERPVTVEHGTNELVESRTEAIVAAVGRRMAAPPATHTVPELWDGAAAGRIVDVFAALSAATPLQRTERR